MPDRHGLEVLKRMKTVQPSLPIIILSLYAMEQFALRAYKGKSISAEPFLFHVLQRREVVHWMEYETQLIRKDGVSQHID